MMVWDGKITSMVCITMTELMVATTQSHVLRYRWDGTQNLDYNLDLRRIPFCINQQVSKGNRDYYLRLQLGFYINDFSCANCGRKQIHY